MTITWFTLLYGRLYLQHIKLSGKAYLKQKRSALLSRLRLLHNGHKQPVG